VVNNSIRGVQLQTAGDSEGTSDTRPFLRKIKRDLTTINLQMEFDSKVPNFMFILPMCLITALFMLNSMWFVYLAYYADSTRDDEDPKSFILSFYISEVAQQISLLLALFLPLAVTNTTADEVAFDIIDTFFCVGESSTWASTASHWVVNSRFGWKVASFRPTMRVLQAAVASSVSLSLIVMSRLVQ
jgi:hypothetical protein